MSDNEKKLTAYERWELPNLEGESRNAKAQSFGLAIKDDEAVEITEEIDEDSVVYEPLTAQQLEEIRLAAYEEGFAQGQDEGQKAGYEEGFAKGQDEGHQQGIEQGHEAGRSEALAQGRAIPRAGARPADLSQVPHPAKEKERTRRPASCCRCPW